MSNPYASPMSQPQYGGLPTPNDKPTVITVFGILNLVFGVFGICGIGASIFFLTALANNPGFQQPPNPILEHPIGYVWNIVGLVVGSCNTFLMIAGGILLLMNKDLGRLLTVLYGYITIGFGIVGMVVMGIIMFGVFNEAMGDQERMTAVIGLVGGSCGGVLGLIYPALAIFFLSRDNVKEYLKRAQ